MAFDADFPTGLFHTLTEPPEEDVQQIAKRYQRFQAARFQQSPMELDIEINKRLQITRQPKPINESLQPLSNRQVFHHPSHDMRQELLFPKSLDCQSIAWDRLAIKSDE